MKAAVFRGAGEIEVTDIASPVGGGALGTIHIGLNITQIKLNIRNLLLKILYVGGGALAVLSLVISVIALGVSLLANRYGVDPFLVGKTVEWHPIMLALLKLGAVSIPCCRLQIQLPPWRPLLLLLDRSRDLTCRITVPAGRRIPTAMSVRITISRQ